MAGRRDFFGPKISDEDVATVQRSTNYVRARANAAMLGSSALGEIVKQLGEDFQIDLFDRQTMQRSGVHGQIPAKLGDPSSRSACSLARRCSQ